MILYIILITYKYIYIYINIYIYNVIVCAIYGHSFTSIPVRAHFSYKKKQNKKRHSSEAYFTPSRIGFCVDCVTQELPSRYITSSAPLDRLVRPRGVLDAVEKRISAEGSMLLMVQNSGESFPPGIYGKTRGK